MNHGEYMRRAMTLAAQAAQEGDVPVGCVIARHGEIVGRGRNRRETHRTALGHGEIEAIADACKNLGGWRLWECTLYVTLEPCPMCAGAIQWANINKVYQGCNVRDAEKIGFRDKVFYEDEMFESEVLDRDECLKLFENYMNRNPQNY